MSFFERKFGSGEGDLKMLIFKSSNSRGILKLRIDQCITQWSDCLTDDLLVDCLTGGLPYWRTDCPD